VHKSRVISAPDRLALLLQPGAARLPRQHQIGSAYDECHERREHDHLDLGHRPPFNPDQLLRTPTGMLKDILMVAPHNQRRPSPDVPLATAKPVVFLPWLIIEPMADDCVVMRPLVWSTPRYPNWLRALLSPRPDRSPPLPR
jgi:hypothetical protein